MHIFDSRDILDDILNVRLQTLGVMEYSFPVNMAGSTYNWHLYDVGGAVSDLNLHFFQLFQLSFSVGRYRSLFITFQELLGVWSLNFSHQRQTWIPYFDDGECIGLIIWVFQLLTLFVLATAIIFLGMPTRTLPMITTLELKNTNQLQLVPSIRYWLFIFLIDTPSHES